MRLDNSAMRSDIDPDVFLPEVFQLRDDLSHLGGVVYDESLTAIILDALPEDMYSTVRVRSIRDPNLGLEEIISMMKTVFIYHYKRSSVLKRSQGLYRKVRNSGREPKMRDSMIESAMTYLLQLLNASA